MTRLDIEPLDEGYIIRHDGKEYAKGSHASMLDKIVDVFGITDVGIIELVQDQAIIPTEEDTKKKDNIKPIIKEPDELETNITEPPKKNPGTIPIFTESGRIPFKKLKPYIDISVYGMGYHDQGDGIIVICSGASKVYTSWKDMFELPLYIDAESIRSISNLKQAAVRQFRKWMHDNPSLLPDGVDPDADFRPQLNIDTKPGNSGDFENITGDYE